MNRNTKIGIVIVILILIIAGIVMVVQTRQRVQQEAQLQHETHLQKVALNTADKISGTVINAGIEYDSVLDKSYLTIELLKYPKPIALGKTLVLECEIYGDSDFLLNKTDIFTVFPSGNQAYYRTKWEMPDNSIWNEIAEGKRNLTIKAMMYPENFPELGHNVAISTEEDAEYLECVASEAEKIRPYKERLLIAIEDGDSVSISYWSDIIYADVTAALVEIEKYDVSPELQPQKEELKSNLQILEKLCKNSGEEIRAEVRDAWISDIRRRSTARSASAYKEQTPSYTLWYRSTDDQFVVRPKDWRPTKNQKEDYGRVV